METRRWINQSQPQTLYVAVFLLYINAAFTLLFGLNDAPYLFAYFLLTDNIDLSRNLEGLTRILIVAGGVAAGYGIANERKWGYKLGVAIAALPLVVVLYVCIAEQLSPLDSRVIGIIPLMFNVAVFALLVHPQSREYQRIWFK
jgi:peptidoglycan/LPS O-acetylase OafA/YrhL